MSDKTILGIGTARSGTGSLAHFLSEQGLDVSHEDTTSIDWRRERRPQRYARLLRGLQRKDGDVACWLAPAIFDLMDDLEDPRCIALLRDKEDTVESLVESLGEERIRRGRKFMGFPFPNYPDCPLEEAWRKYWEDYRRIVGKLTAAYPERVLCVQTENLGSEDTQQEIGEFLELESLNTVKPCHKNKRDG